MNFRQSVSTAAMVAVLLTAGCNRAGKNDAKYKTEKAAKGDITMTVTATGTLSAVKTVQIGSQVSGVISRLYADFNSHVTRGQLLAELDSTPFQAQVEQRQADVRKAEVDLANAGLTLNRQERLVRAGLTAQAELDGARATYGVARAQVDQSRAALSQSVTNLRYTKITSPIDGVVVDRQYDVGQTVAASFQAPTLFSLAQDLTKMQVQADVDQSDIGRVQVDQVARFNVDAYPEQEFRGRIAQIRLNATVAQNVVSYPVIIEVPNMGERLRPKMTANVTIDVSQVSEVLRVPNADLRFKPEVTAGDKTATAAPTTASAPSSASSASGGSGGNGGANGGGRSGGGAGGWASMTPEQRAARRAARDAAGGGGGAPVEKKPQTIYILDANNVLKPIQIRIGISDGHYTQVLGGDLKEGDIIVTGLATSKVEGPAAFGGQGGPGGGGRGGAGGRGGR